MTQGDKQQGLQERLIRLSTKHQGYTMTQLAWLAVGGTVDANGFCLPAEAFAQAQQFETVRRRGREAVLDSRKPANRQGKARLVYGRAVCNPYESGGQGVYPLGARAVRVAAVGKEVAPKVACPVPDFIRALSDSL